MSALTTYRDNDFRITSSRSGRGRENAVLLNPITTLIYDDINDRGFEKNLLVFSSDSLYQGFERAEFIISRHSVNKYVKALKSFLDLNFNWNGYGADKPNHHAIHNAIKIIEKYNSCSFAKIQHCYPLDDGGIQVDLKKNGFEYELEIYENSLRVLKFDESSELLSESEINFNEDQIFEFL